MEGLRKGIKCIAAMRSLPKSVARGGAQLGLDDCPKGKGRLPIKPEHDDSGLGGSPGKERFYSAGTSILPK